MDYSKTMEFLKSLTFLPSFMSLLVRSIEFENSKIDILENEKNIVYIKSNTVSLTKDTDIFQCKINDGKKNYLIVIVFKENEKNKSLVAYLTKIAPISNVQPGDKSKCEDVDVIVITSFKCYERDPKFFTKAQKSDLALNPTEKSSTYYINIGALNTTSNIEKYTPLEIIGIFIQWPDDIVSIENVSNCSDSLKYGISELKAIAIHIEEYLLLSKKEREPAQIIFNLFLLREDAEINVIKEIYPAIKNIENIRQSALQVKNIDREEPEPENESLNDNNLEDLSYNETIDHYLKKNYTVKRILEKVKEASRCHASDEQIERDILGKKSKSIQKNKNDGKCKKISSQTKKPKRKINCHTKLKNILNG